jgi:hypothetical protein
MSPLAVVEHLDKLEDRLSGIVSGVESLPLDQFKFQRGEEALRYCIIPTIPLNRPVYTGGSNS